MMVAKDEAVANPHFRIEYRDGHEQIRAWPKKNKALLIFSPVWLAGWTVSGLVVIWHLFANHYVFVSLIAVSGWAFFLMVNATYLAWTLWGYETLLVLGDNLEITYTLGPISRRRRYRCSQIGNLRVMSQSDMFGGNKIDNPVVSPGRTGAIQFHYGARTIYAAPGLDESEGQMIVEHLAKRLPSSVTAAVGRG